MELTRQLSDPSEEDHGVNHAGERPVLTPVIFD